MLNSLITFLVNLIIGFIGIGLVVFIHELGHFITARLLHVNVETFSFGMGPTILSKQGKNTEFRISLLPFGGYCRIAGSVELAKALKDKAATFTHTEKGSFFGTSPLKRFLIFLSGPVTNFLLAIILFTLISAFSTQEISNKAYVLNISSYPTLYNQEFKQAEVKDGDLILEVEGVKIQDYESLVKILSTSDGTPLKAKVLRDDKEIDITLTPFENNGRYSFGLALYQAPIVGRVEKGSLFKVGDRIISVNGHAIRNTNDFYSFAVSNESLDLVVERDGDGIDITINGGTEFDFAWKTDLKKVKGLRFTSALRAGFEKTIYIARQTTEVTNTVFKQKHNAEEVRNTITGPTRAAQTIGSISMLGADTSFFMGIRALLYLLSIVSVSICLINLLPIPNFDGGQMLINLYAMTTKKELTPKSYVVLQVFGLICTVIILLFMYGLDLIHYLGN